jgi:hypothetical protein
LEDEKSDDGAQEEEKGFLRRVAEQCQGRSGWKKCGGDERQTAEWTREQQREKEEEGAQGVKTPSQNGEGDEEEIAGGKKKHENKKLLARWGNEQNDRSKDLSEERRILCGIAQTSEGDCESDE